MSDLIVIAFPGDPAGADRAAERLEQLGDAGTITPDDAVLVDIDESGKLKLHQAFAMTGEGALSGALIGGALGFALTIPFGPVGPAVLLIASVTGLGVGAATGGWIGHHRDYGIPDDFAQQLGDSMPPNSSALFVLVPKDQCDVAATSFDGLGATVHSAKLDAEGERRLAESMAQAPKHTDAETSS